MSYTMSQPVRRHARGRLAGLGFSLVAQAATDDGTNLRGLGELDLSAEYGDFNNHPLVKYMQAVMPASFPSAVPPDGLVPPSSAWGPKLADAVHLAMLAMQYQGQPLPTVLAAARAVAAANANLYYNLIYEGSNSALDAAASMAAADGYLLLISVAQAVSAMKKPIMQLSINPAMVACAKAQGVWDPKAGKCLPRLVIKPMTTRQGTRAPAPAPTSAPAGATSKLGLYLGIAAGVLALGTVGYLATR